MIGDIRYWRGKFKIIIASRISPMKTVLIQVQECGVIGFKNLGYRVVCSYENVVCRIRDCWRNKK